MLQKTKINEWIFQKSKQLTEGQVNLPIDEVFLLRKIRNSQRLFTMSQEAFRQFSSKSRIRSLLSRRVLFVENEKPMIFFYKISNLMTNCQGLRPDSNFLRKTGKCQQYVNLSTPPSIAMISELSIRFPSFSATFTSYLLDTPSETFRGVTWVEWKLQGIKILQ